MARHEMYSDGFEMTRKRALRGRAIESHNHFQMNPKGPRRISTEKLADLLRQVGGDPQTATDPLPANDPLRQLDPNRNFPNTFNSQESDELNNKL